MQYRYKYLVGILLPEPWRSRIKEVQNKYKTDAWNISLDPHITLLPPGKAMVAEDDAEIILESVAKGFQPFEMLADGVDSFANASHSVFGAIRDTHEVFRLHKELEDVAQEFMDLNMEELRSRPFHPHFTLANRLESEQKQKEILQELSSQLARFSFVCDSFSLFKKFPEEKQWAEAKRFLF